MKLVIFCRNFTIEDFIRREKLSWSEKELRIGKKITFIVSATGEKKNLWSFGN